jgi:long-chain acyl-CoA synthetase
MSPQLFQKVEKSFGAGVQEGYGLTETCSMAFSNPINGIRKPGSIGKPIEGVEMILLDENNNQIKKSSSEENNEIGEICIRGQIVTEGYFGSPEETQKAFFTETEHKDLWLRTGDLGFLDKDGYLFLVDRKKDLIVHSGHKVYPREVEEVLEKHPLVDQVAVIGVLAGELHGEKIKAFVVLKNRDPNNKILSDEQKDQLKIELKNFCKKELAKFKVPNFFEFIDEIPKTPSGKLKRLELRNKK